MIVKEYNGHKPRIAESAFVAEDAVLIGDVEIQADASVWYGCVLRGDSGRIVIGEGSNVQDGCILHCDRGFAVNIGRHVTIGHGAIVHGATIEDEVLIGMRATLLNGARVESAGQRTQGDPRRTAGAGHSMPDERAAQRTAGDDPVECDALYRTGKGVSGGAGTGVMCPCFLMENKTDNLDF